MGSYLPSTGAVYPSPPWAYGAVNAGAAAEELWLLFRV
jgi:hypothetical protein